MAAVLTGSAHAQTPATTPQTKRVAAIVTIYRHNSHADVIVSRLLQTDTLDGKGAKSHLQLVSLYTDQIPEKDTSRKLAAEHKFPIYDTVEEALTLGSGGGKLAVDGVLLVAEHGDYPHNAVGNTQYPKRRLFEQIVKVFEKSGRVVPVFCDKHLADNWEDAKWIYDTAQRMKIPMMAGSSLPTLWRIPPTDLPRGAEVKEMVAVSYHTLDHYGFHGLEMVQCLLEQRKGGEHGIKAVQCLTGDAVWEAGDKGVYDQELFQAAFKRQKVDRLGSKTLKEMVKEPVLFTLEYADGFKAHILTLNYAVGEWAAAWRLKDGTTDSTLFWTQEARPFFHFAIQVRGIEQMMLTGKPAWPVERTLMTSGALDALLISKSRGGERVETPHLMFQYQSDWRWREPQPPPPGRPIMEQ
jgi:hypothetical protein